MKIDLGPLHLSSLNNTLSSRADRSQDAEHNTNVNNTRLSDADAKSLAQSGARNHQTLQGLPELEASKTPKFVVFEGLYMSRVMPESEQTHRMQAIMERLPSEPAKSLVDMGLIDDEDFINFASKLKDEDLINFAKVALGLQTKSKIGEQVVLANSGSAKAFMQQLATLDADTMNRTLSIASELSEKIPRFDSTVTYEANGRLPEGSSAANDLQNFVKMINRISGSSLSKDVNNIFDKLENHTQDQQSNLLPLMARDVDLGMRMMDSLTEYSQETQDSVLSYVSKLTNTISHFSVTPQDRNNRHTLPEGHWSGSIIDFDKNDEYVILDMVDSFISISEDYQVSDVQLEKMATDLSGMDNLNQRAYIEITATGLSTLLNGNSESPVDLAQHEDALEVIDDLRSSSTVRDLITKSRKGEQHYSGGRAFYEDKNLADSERDQRTTIELLSKDAWLHQGDTLRNNRFAANLNGLNADQRDALIDELNSTGESRDALAKYSPEQLFSDYQTFINRTNAMAQSHDLERLLEIETALPENQKQNYWQALDFLNEDLNKLVSAIEVTDTQEQKLLIDYVSALAESVNREELSQPDAQRQVITTLELFIQRSTD